MKKNKYNDAYDDDGILKDGRTVRVSMQMRDATMMHRANSVTDGTGDSLGLHRPGYRVIGDTVARDAKANALRDYEKRLTSAWRDDNGDPDDDGDDNGVGSIEFMGAQEGDLCTVRNAQYPLSFGSPGHIRNGICTPDSPRRSRSAADPASDSANERRRALADYDRTLREAWRTK
jgi:hypothetical protein